MAVSPGLKRLSLVAHGHRQGLADAVSVLKQLSGRLQAEEKADVPILTVQLCIDLLELHLKEYWVASNERSTTQTPESIGQAIGESEPDAKPAPSDTAQYSKDSGAGRGS